MYIYTVAYLMKLLIILMTLHIMANERRQRPTIIHPLFFFRDTYPKSKVTEIYNITKYF